METTARNFISEIISDDALSGRRGVVTRFPPEPNGYLHIGHAKSICLNFGLAAEFGGRCHLRFDDTNPEKEEAEYEAAIKRDVAWLGFDWGEHLYYASDYFEKLYEYATLLIRRGKAYVCDLSSDGVRESRGTLSLPGRDSPWRERSIEENLDLFARMRAGEFPDGGRTLRARIDMASPNINMRDPALYRIRRASHHRTGDAWCIYPMYDFAHGLSDAIEKVTHSICTLEFEDHRPLYDWFLRALDIPSPPRQIEFARLNLTYTVMSKRKLLALVEKNLVAGWDDPRMPTIAGLRRRGYPASAIRSFCADIGVAKTNSTIDIARLEFHARETLNATAPRVMAVIDPLRVVIENYPEGLVEELEAENISENPSAGVRQVPFSRVIYIERDDFMENPPGKFFRLAPGREVRLKHAYYITCERAVKDEHGNITELICRYDPDSRGGSTPDGRKVKGTLHWVSEDHAVPAEVRLYDRLFMNPDPEDLQEGADFTSGLDPKSFDRRTGSLAERSLREAPVGATYQFLRHGYFSVDGDSSARMLVFNRTVSLKDSWAKADNRGH